MNYTGQSFTMILFAMTAQRKSLTMRRRNINMINNLAKFKKRRIK
jgi:hypothetical protein